VKTNSEPGAAKNPCYVCHSRSEPPNFVNDDDLQSVLQFPPLARDNPWENVLDPPYLHTARATDEAVLAYVRASNYVDDDGSLTLARVLEHPPTAWDGNGNGRWDGYAPDVRFAFDDRGFDHAPDGSFTGWRAYAYFPLPGAFLPANGSASDALIRLDPLLREDAEGHFDRAIYELNLAIVEALIRRVDVGIDATDEKALGVDLDLDGHLGVATRVAFDAAPDGTGKTRMRYVGRARIAMDEGKLPIAPGLYPTGTELFHTVRYLDVGADGTVGMAARMKEVRYAKKTQWSSYAVAKANALRETREQDESRDGVHEVRWQSEIGVYSNRGWVLQGFIEAADGSLRPQSYDESAFCDGCHGGVGSTTDSTFSFARKLGDGARARGWFHASPADFRGVPEPKRADGRFEYTLYLNEAGGGDDLRDNREILARFFDERGAVRPAAVERLHADVSTLLSPTPARALDLDRAYQAIVLTQSFSKGRDAALVATDHAYAHVPLGGPTGIASAVVSRGVR
jgi:hypothetical protein